jgi:mono/diheme cytochrome c family protein
MTKLIVVVFLVCGFAIASAQQAAAPPVFTAAQADAGRETYKTVCAACHAADLSGAEGPQLAGSDFMKNWGSQTTKDLLDYAQGMPPDGARLKPEEYLNVVSFILQQNGATAGAEALTAATKAPVGTVATGKRPGA